ncbi:hypothetical protein ACIPI6_15065 [Pseudomonas protegens]|uniref:hypothetical protein n=1 Tax=Pseudomonas protegens TaxID=380021 RepID=UPI0037FA1290
MKPNRLVYGIGVKDVPYKTVKSEDGQPKHDPFYSKWSDMLMRCYSRRYKAKYPTYEGCQVVEEWLYFSGFRAWMVKQPWQGNALDKDIIIPGNKTYSPDACAFVPRWLNNFLCDNAAQRGSWPIGVSLLPGGKFSATIESGGRSMHLGRFNSPDQAHKAYLIAKAEETYKRIQRYIADGGSDERVILALSDRAKKMTSQ